MTLRYGLPRILNSCPSVSLESLLSKDLPKLKLRAQIKTVGWYIREALETGNEITRLGRQLWVLALAAHIPENSPGKTP